jgi:hypothetical protein
MRYDRRPRFIIGVAAFLVGLAGCYPPPPDVQPVQFTAADEETALDLGALMPSPGSARKEAINDFREAYHRQQSPRLIILVNPALESAPATPFEPYAMPRRVIKVRGRHVPIQPEHSKVSTGKHTPSRLTPPNDSSKFLDEPVEEGIVRTFLDAGCNVIDATVARRNLRDAIERLGQQDSAAGRAAAQLQALTRQADLLLTVTAQRQVVSSGDRALHVISLAAKASDLRSARTLGQWYIHVEAEPSLTLAPDLARGASFVLACRLMEQMTQAWANGNLYTLAIHDLTSDIELGHILNFIQSIPGARHVVTLAVDIVPQGGRADIQFEFGGPPDELTRLLRKPTALPGARIETTGRRGTAFSMKVVAR